MAVTVENLADYLGASAAEPTLPDLLLEAVELVDEHLGSKGTLQCPERTHDLAIKTLASELYARRNGPGGAVQWGPDGQVVRLARDPLVSVRAMLRPYKGFGALG